MRILQVDSGREWRGGQHQVWLLCRALGHEPDIEQTLGTQRDSELARRVGAAGIPVHGTAWDMGLDPRVWWHLRRTIAAFEPDVIHAHDSHALTLAATVARGRAVVATRRVEFHIGRFGAWRRADRIIAISAAVKLVLSSRSEGLGSVLLNALALGRPVVATGVGGIPEILPPEALVPVDAAELLAQKVMDTLATANPPGLPAGFTASAMAHGVLDVYRAHL